MTKSELIAKLAHQFPQLNRTDASDSIDLILQATVIALLMAVGLRFVDSEVLP